MGISLADIGRARPADDIRRNVVDVIEQGRESARRDARVQSLVNLRREQTAQIQEQRAQHQKMSQRHPWLNIANTFYGGPGGKVAKYAETRLRRMGLMEDVNGVPMITGYGMQKAGELLFNSKEEQINLLGVQKEATLEDIRRLQGVLLEKPGDKKSMEELAVASQAFTDVDQRLDLLDKNYQTMEEKEIAEKGREREYEVEQAKLGQKDRQLDLMEEKLRLDKRKATREGADKPDKRESSLRSDFIKWKKEAISAFKGTGSFFPLEKEVRMKAAEDALKQAEVVARQYAKQYDIRDLGLEDINDLNRLRDIPEGLTQETIDKYEAEGYTLPQIIKAFERYVEDQQQGG